MDKIHGRLIDADEYKEKLQNAQQEPDYQHEGEDWRTGLLRAETLLSAQKTIACSANDYTIKDMAWTLAHFFDDELSNVSEEKMLSCARAMLFVGMRGYGDCYPLQDFIDAVETGMFTPYDGNGYFVDKNGKEICDVWVNEIPDEAEYVMWFNK